jgi:hypothetical protein
VKPLLVVLLLLAGGLGLTLIDRWRVGSAVIGVALSLAAALRLVLPKEHLGDLAVRSRAVDAAVLLVLGFAIVGLANTIPSGH